MSRAENALVVRAQVLDAIVRTGAQGLALSELRVLLPGVKRSTLYSALAALREADRIYTINRQPVALSFATDVPRDDASSSFRARYPVLKAEIANAISLGHQRSDKRAGERPAAKSPQPRRRRTSPKEGLDHLQTNRMARTLRGDGTHGPAPAARAVTVTRPDSVVTVICPPVRRRFDDLTSTGDSGIARDPGRYSEPPSRWASAALQARESS